MSTPVSPSTAPPPRWPDADLEAFLDGALPDARTGDLAADLREDPALRSRLAAITRADSLARAALLAPPAGAAADRRSRPPALLAAVAATLTLVASFAILRPGRPAAVPQPRAAQPPAAAAAAQGGIRIVLAIPARTRPASTKHALTPPPKPDAAPQPALPTALLASDDPADRAAAYRRLGEVLRSAAAANAALDALSPAEQLAACRLWADDPRLRPVVFPRLRTLADHPDLTDDLAIVLADLKDRPDLRGWLASHNLLAAVAEPAHAGNTSG